MLKIRLMNKIAKVGTDVLSPAKYEIGADVTSVKVGDRVIVSWGTHSSISTVREKFITKILQK